MKKNISAVIPTYNEEKHIGRCIESLAPFVQDIFIIDSFSTDRTKQIAEALGANVLEVAWENNYAKKYNWGLQHAPITTEWVLRMDADEYVLPELRDEIISKLDAMDSAVTGIYLKRRVLFLGKWIRHGGSYPIWLLRIWRHTKGFCENRWMDEHIQITEGTAMYLEHDFVDDNLNSLEFWSQKHIVFAIKEAIDLLNIKYGFLGKSDTAHIKMYSQDSKKRWFKETVYAHLPLFIRPCLFFVYRYFLRLGFLDGKAGLIRHFLQSFWYRFLVDSYVYEVKKKAKKENMTIKEAIASLYNDIKL